MTKGMTGQAPGRPTPPVACRAPSANQLVTPLLLVMPLSHDDSVRLEASCCRSYYLGLPPTATVRTIL